MQFTYVKKYAAAVLFILQEHNINHAVNVNTISYWYITIKEKKQVYHEENPSPREFCLQ